jgi:hypothetical protein
MSGKIVAATTLVLAVAALAATLVAGVSSGAAKKP